MSLRRAVLVAALSSIGTALVAQVTPDAPTGLPSAIIDLRTPRILLILRGKRRPGLAAGTNGTIIATWTVGENRLTLQCQPGDSVRWIVTQIIDGQPDTAAGQTTVAHLMQRLQAFNPEQWFTDEGRQSAT